MSPSALALACAANSRFFQYSLTPSPNEGALRLEPELAIGVGSFAESSEPGKNLAAPPPIARNFAASTARLLPRKSSNASRSVEATAVTGATGATGICGLSEAPERGRSEAPERGLRPMEGSRALLFDFILVASGACPFGLNCVATAFTTGSARTSSIFGRLSGLFCNIHVTMLQTASQYRSCGKGSGSCRKIFIIKAARLSARNG
mmetsp:Transcript_29907/g.48267  ORF Transcript_29907/g.48267 Transcript_29907/m.48267 type:complete len:206 (+) Transcript_29907:1802-2419(+)